MKCSYEREGSLDRRQAASSRSPKLAAYTTATHAAQRRKHFASADYARHQKRDQP
jgi:uncharacterized protein HemY